MGGNAFGFMNLGQAAQGQPPIQQQAPQTYGTMPPGVTDPQSQYLAQALKSMQGQQQGSAGGLASNLLADALMQYGLKRRQDQLNGPRDGKMMPGILPHPGGAGGGAESMAGLF